MVQDFIITTGNVSVNYKNVEARTNALQIRQHALNNPPGGGWNTDKLAMLQAEITALENAPPDDN